MVGCAGHALPPAPAAPPHAADVAPLPAFVDPRQTVGYLASDAFAGRAPGTAGLQQAGDFLADEFRRIGLQPVPSLQGFFQPFTMPLATTLDAATLAIDDRPLAPAIDFSPMGVSGQGVFSGAVVFAGYGIQRGVYDDYAGLDVRGKVVLAMRQEPRDAHGRSRFASPFQQWSPAAAVRSKAGSAADHGASALLLVTPPSNGGADVVSPFSADSRGAGIPVVAVTRRVADLLLADASLPALAALQQSIDAAGQPHSLPLDNQQAEGTVKLQRHAADVRNVIAELPGAGPQADQWVVVGAHYDHLGTGQLGHLLSPAGSIYHGADDNASGTAALLELAERMKLAPPTPRSILFCCFTGEEEGLLGSDWFVKHPPVALRQIVAMLNLDMVGRLHNDNLLVGGWGTAAGFEAMVRGSLTGTPLHWQSFEKGGLGPSDHMSFALARIPVLFYFTGLHADYHRPTDTADKINYAGIDEIAGVCQHTVDAMAAMPRPAYDDSNDANSVMASLSGHGPAGSGRGRAVLGVVPDFSAFDGSAGVRVSGVGDAGPAAKAGLQPGDVLTRLADQPLSNLQDLSDALARQKPGDAVAIRLLRNGKALELHAILGERGEGE
jgi:hypothetical protein